MSSRHEIPEGIKVEIEHWRYVKDVYTETIFLASPDILKKHRVVLIILPRGGKTVVHLIDEEGNVLVSGVAYCNKVRGSKKPEGHLGPDSYCKKFGARIALGRALKDYYSRLDINAQ
jgi:hypothetical protein